MSDIKLKLLTTYDEILEVHSLRGPYIDLDDNRKIDPKLFEKEEARRDKEGLVFAFVNDENKTIGTVRFVKFGSNLTTSEALLNHHNHSHIYNKHFWEIGRLVFLPSYRTNKLLVTSVIMVLKFLINHTNITHLMLSSTPIIARLYKKFGSETLFKDLVLPDIDKKYTVTHGHMPEIAKKIAQLEHRQHAREVEAVQPKLELVRRSQ